MRVASSTRYLHHAVVREHVFPVVRRHVPPVLLDRLDHGRDDVAAGAVHREGPVPRRVLRPEAERAPALAPHVRAAGAAHLQRLDGGAVGLGLHRRVRPRDVGGLPAVDLRAGFGYLVALRCRGSTSYQLHEEIR